MSCTVIQLCTTEVLTAALRALDVRLEQSRQLIVFARSAAATSTQALQMLSVGSYVREKIHMSDKLHVISPRL